MKKKYIKHILKEGARFHVISYIGIGTDWRGRVKGVQRCSEPNCEINKEYDELQQKTHKSN